MRLAASVGLAIAMSSVAGFAADRPVVVELFTSQGCSACPPANAYLNELSKGRADVLPLGFHVTDWDYLGWKDPFSFEAATTRQALYARHLGGGSYTPEMVVDGAVGLVGSYRSAVGSAIDRAKQQSPTATNVQVARTGDGVSVTVGSGTGSAKILLVGFDHQHVTPVGRGENTGRTLVELNVVRSVRSVGQWSGRSIQIDAPFPEGQDVAVLLEAPDGQIVGAARLSPGGA